MVFKLMCLRSLALAALFTAGFHPSECIADEQSKVEAKKRDLPRRLFGRESLLLNSAVQTELKLSEAQLAAVSSAFADARSKMQEIVENGVP
jgi:hypothetical protein